MEAVQSFTRTPSPEPETDLYDAFVRRIQNENEDFLPADPYCYCFLEGSARNREGHNLMGYQLGDGNWVTIVPQYEPRTVEIAGKLFCGLLQEHFPAHGANGTANVHFSHIQWIETKEPSEGIPGLPPVEAVLGNFASFPKLDGTSVKNFLAAYSDGNVGKGMWGTYALLRVLLQAVECCVGGKGMINNEAVIRMVEQHECVVYQIVGFFLRPPSQNNQMPIGKVTATLTIEWGDETEDYDPVYHVDMNIEKESTNYLLMAGASFFNMSGGASGTATPVSISFGRQPIPQAPVKSQPEERVRPGPLRTGPFFGAERFSPLKRNS